MIYTLLFLSQLLFSSTAPSSDIPDRREFPINTEVDPCNDFYKYTCSKVKDSFKLREDRSSHTFSFSDSHERLLEQKKNYLQSIARQPKKTEGEKELSDIFLSCMNVDQRAEDEKERVAELIKSIKEIDSREEFIKFNSERMLTPKYSMVDFGVSRNLDKPYRYDLNIGTDVRGLPETSYYKDKKVLKAYERLVADFFKTLGFKDYKKRAKNIVRFEKDFDKVYPKPAEWRELYSQRNYIARKEIKDKYPAFHLEKLFSKAPNETKVRHFAPESYSFINKKLQEEDLETLKSLFLFHALSPMMDKGYDDFYDKKFAFRKEHLGGPKKRSVLKEQCTEYVKSEFSKELDYELYPKLFKDFSEKKFLKLVKKVRNSLIEGIEENTWLSKKGKKNAKKKMKTAFLQVVKPRNEEEWDFVEKANFSPRYFLANQELRAEKEYKKLFEDLDKKLSNKTWYRGPLFVNAYYSASNNKFVMPVGILQYPFYDQNLAEHQNLGAIGMVIGHELGHGIDDKGSKYDHKGRLNQWMSEKDLKEFNKRGSQLISQFNEVGHDGELTLGENIGDLVGLTAAYNAAFPEGKGSSEHKKEFFVQYGRSWCGVMRPGERKRRLKTDPHSMSEARVNEQVKHQPGFIKAYSCKPGDKMYLSEKERVSIW